MVKRAQVRLIVILALFLACAFAGLGYRLVELQVLRHEEMTAEAAERTVRERLMEPRRGDILDIKGNVLATTEYRKLVYADPSMITDWHEPLASMVAQILKTNATKIETELRRLYRTNLSGTNRYAIIQRNVEVGDWNRLRDALKTFDPEPGKVLTREQKDALDRVRKSIGATDQPLRIYPQKRLASHVVGFASAEEKAIADLSITDARTPAVNQIVGRDGMELLLDQKLAGAHGWRVTEYGRLNDKRRTKVELVTQRRNEVAARDGLNVVLTIDSYIQDLLEKALAEGRAKYQPVSISGIVVRPGTGEILAMACLPDYDPNLPNETTLDARRNRAISDIAEPGSTFKIVVVAGALSDKIVSLRDVFDCEKGRFWYGGRSLSDHHAYDDLTVEEIITKSSNIGAAKIGIKLGEKRLYDYVRAFGFGSRTGIPLLGEVPGIVYPTSAWRKVALAQIPMGHGIAVTRLQMIMAMCAIANKGQLMRPMLVDRLEDQDHIVVAKYTPQTVKQVIREEAAADMVKALKTVVGEGGTAPKAALENYTVAGKTGTAQKPVPGGYSHDRFFSSFIGFLPADDPAVCIGIYLDEPNRKVGYFGGTVAGPIFKEVAEGVAKYLSIPPDRVGTNDLKIATLNVPPGAGNLSGREP